MPLASMRDWPVSERPRERLIAAGAPALSDAELLAVLLQTGLPGRSALDVARELLVRFAGLRGVLAAPLPKFRATPGLGEARYACLQAAVELARRTLREELAQRDALSSPALVRQYLALALQNRPNEIFVGLFLDSQNRLLAAEELFRGTLNQTAVYPREVARLALERNAAAVIFAHNHPSGVAEPSHADRMLTHALRGALQQLDIAVLDHVIVAGAHTYSFAENGIL
ncbi:MAG TPA: DNA repair protein RadC [Burkholderiaceae bacterium]|nr:DNA repair protein RadC [Burkholderiaceae bacterium]